MIIIEENFKWHLEAFASELFKCTLRIIACFPFVFFVIAIQIFATIVSMIYILQDSNCYT